MAALEDQGVPGTIVVSSQYDSSLLTKETTSSSSTHPIQHYFLSIKDKEEQSEKQKKQEKQERIVIGLYGQRLMGAPMTYFHQYMNILKKMYQIFKSPSQKQIHFKIENDGLHNVCNT